MKDGKQVTIRPIRPEDEPAMVEFHQKLSERSVYLRYFQPLKLTQRTAHERLTRACFIDYDREMALVAERHECSRGAGNPGGRPPEQAARPRVKRNWLRWLSIEAQHKGLGTELYRRLIQLARDEKLTKVVSNMLPENREMRAMCTRLGFQMFSSLEDNMIRAELEL